MPSQVKLGHETRRCGAVSLTALALGVSVFRAVASGASAVGFRGVWPVTCYLTIAMTTELTGEDFFIEQFQEADEEELQWDASDELDVIYKFDARISKGWKRSVQLREGIWLIIDRHQPTDRLIINRSGERHHSIHCLFTLSGKGQGRIPSALSETLRPYISGKYSLRSTGLHSQEIGDYSDIDPISILQIYIHPSVLRSFAASSEGELPPNLQHLIKPQSQEVYLRSRDTTPMMATTLQQILHCPYQGLVKRAYLEGKVIELMALVLDHEITIQQGEAKKISLKPEQLEQIHYAREILLKDMGNPPSLAELAHQAGLNEFTLKQGFRQIFGTTVFGELRAYRLDIAKQLLAERDLSIAEVAHLVGYASLSSFYKTFRHKFGITPKAYQKACR